MKRKMDDPTCTKKSKLPHNKAAKNNSQRPNWFLAFQFDNPDILDKVKNIQNDVIEQEPKLSQACVPVAKSHLSLYVFNTQNVDKVVEIVSEVVSSHEFNDDRPNETCIEVDGIGNFRNQVVFAKMTLNPKLQELWQNIGAKLVENSIIPENAMKNFTPHMTLMKLSRMDFKKRKKNGIKKMPVELYDDKWQNQYFGCQKINSVQLLSMTKPPQKNGYYFCQHTFPLKFVQKQAPSNKMLYAVISGVTALVAVAYILRKYKK